MKKLEKTQSQELDQASGGVSLRTEEPYDSDIICYYCNYKVTIKPQQKSFCKKMCEQYNKDGIRCPDCRKDGGWVVMHP